ncbi:MAG: peptidase M61, partial [Bacteroidia bacterium]|nr:peptidase M61 [Bacteroidia bacterium]
EKIHKQYNNVYEKGAVIGMCLDIMLRDMSNGKYGTQDLMKDLATKYGKDKSFNDKDLFNDIEKFTYPEIGAFLRTHVGGGKPLPMEDVLNRIGIKFIKESESYDFTFGVNDINYNEDTKRLFVESTNGMDEFGKALGFKKGDEISKLNGKELTLETAREVFGEYYSTVKEGQMITVDIFRPKGKSKFKEKTLKAPARKIKVIHKNEIALADNVSEKQKNCLRSWIGLN